MGRDPDPPRELTSAVLNKVVYLFEPARMTQARALAWLTKSELAKRIGVSASAIGQYESGTTKPRPDLLPALGRALGVPVEFFSTGRPLGRLDAADVHFHSLRSTMAKDRAKASAHAEQVWELTYAIEKQVRFPAVDLPALPEGTPPLVAAQMLRASWGIPSGPVPHLAATMESRGVVVCLIPLTNEAVTRVGAYSTSALSRPIVVVTPERFKSVYEYRFTCAHELGHLLMHHSALPGNRKQEREADQFAAELLTPQTEIGPLLPRSVRLAALDGLSRTWGVSVESLVYRMGELGIISESTVRRAHQRLATTAQYRRSEPLTAYPGEVPSLLTESIDLTTRNGYDRNAIATELCWTSEHLDQVLGEVDTRPLLRPRPAFL